MIEKVYLLLCLQNCLIIVLCSSMKLMAVCHVLTAVFLLQVLVDTRFVQCTDHEITYVQPQRFIKCPSPDEVCDIQLTISSMLTLTAYTTSNGARGGSGYEVTINEKGGLDFLPRDSVTETELFQPIVAEGTTRRQLLVINDQLPGPIPSSAIRTNE